MHASKTGSCPVAAADSLRDAGLLWTRQDHLHTVPVSTEKKPDITRSPVPRTDPKTGQKGQPAEKTQHC